MAVVKRQSNRSNPFAYIIRFLGSYVVSSSQEYWTIIITIDCSKPPETKPHGFMQLLPSPLKHLPKVVSIPLMASPLLRALVLQLTVNLLLVFLFTEREYGDIKI